MEHTFKQQENEGERLPFFERVPVKIFVEERNIATEDLHLIETLSTFPKNMIIEELHNMFNMNKDRSGTLLEALIKNSHDESKKILYKIALEFFHRYNWATSWNLVRVLEELSP